VKKNMKKENKKSQFKIQQMSFMLLAVVLFFILVALFWLAFQYSSLKKQATETSKEQAVLLAEFISGSSEFSCASEQGSYCVDTDKIIVLKNASYKELWPVSYIKIKKITKEKEKDCNIANYPNCTNFNVFDAKTESTSTAGSFIALCRHERVAGYVQNICELGKIMIGYEAK